MDAPPPRRWIDAPPPAVDARLPDPLTGGLLEPRQRTPASGPSWWSTHSAHAPDHRPVRAPTALTVASPRSACRCARPQPRRAAPAVLLLPGALSPAVARTITASPAASIAARCRLPLPLPLRACYCPARCSPIAIAAAPPAAPPLRRPSPASRPGARPRSCCRCFLVVLLTADSRAASAALSPSAAAVPDGRVRRPRPLAR
nr:atherin-like [Aegilops tauschii subsp. strangulata]